LTKVRNCGGKIVNGSRELAVLKIAGHPVGSAEGHEEKILTTRLGLLFPSLLTFSAWQQAGQQIHRLHDSSAWCLGDWLVYGQREYVSRYRTAIEAAGLDYQTLRNYAWVARSFDLGRRREKLSFQHHAEVASLSREEQDRAWMVEKRASAAGSRRSGRRCDCRRRKTTVPPVHGVG
jgi:hypothetical protein